MNTYLRQFLKWPTINSNTRKLELIRLKSISTFICYVALCQPCYATPAESLCDVISNDVLAKQHIERNSLHEERITVSKKFYGTSRDYSQVMCTTIDTSEKSIGKITLVGYSDLDGSDADIVINEEARLLNLIQKLSISSLLWDFPGGWCNFRPQKLSGCFGKKNGKIIFVNFIAKTDADSKLEMQNYFESIASKIH